MKSVIPAVAIIFSWGWAAWAAPAARVLTHPVTSAEKLSTNNREHDLTQRVRVRGTITYYEPGRAVVLENSSRSVWVQTKTASSELRVNDGAEAIGFPETEDGLSILTNGEVSDNNVPAGIAAQPMSWQQLALGSHPFDLVSIEGRLVTQIREELEDVIVISSDGGLISVVYSHRNGATPTMKQISPGSLVRVTGICIPQNSKPFRLRNSFEILLRDADDIVVISRPFLLSILNSSMVLGAMSLTAIAVSAWVWILKRKIRRQTGELATMAYLEQRRGRILADINSSKPLVEIIETITQMISYMLSGAPCWCDVVDGARLGEYPPDADKLQVLSEEIPARSGPPLGTLFAGLDSGSLPGIRRSLDHEKEVLSGGAKLAMLAMETRRLYSDLLRRSEVDLLTNVHNRRSLGERMDALIEEACQNASVFGLIYIDLDKFKPINDRYGHHVGDLFLQEVAERMKKQLRSHDLLARLGGDEFAVLLPMVRNRTRIEEIALRLEHCFKEPFLIEGNTLHGSASFGYSIYPEDGATKESLLSAADAAMYAAKNFRKQAASRSAGLEDPLLSDHRST